MINPNKLIASVKNKSFSFINDFSLKKIFLFKKLFVLLQCE